MTEGPKSKQVSGIIDATRIPTLDLTKLSTVGANEVDVPTIVGGVWTPAPPSSGGTAPTASTWGADSRYGTGSNMSGDLTLVDGDNTVQMLDPGGADRVVTLPTPSTSSKFFLLTHVGTGNTITVKAHTGATVATLATSEAAWCWTDGSAWAVAEWSIRRVRDLGFATLAFGGDPGVNNAFLPVNFPASSGTNDTIALYPHESVVPRAGTVSQATIVTDAATSTNGFDIYKNGAQSETVTPVTMQAGSLAAHHAVVTATTAVVAGDELAVRSQSSAVGDTVVRLYVEQSATTTGATIPFGGQPSNSTTNQFFQVNASYAISAATSAANVAVAPVDCALGSLSWSTSNATAASTQWEVYKNGATDQAVVATGAQGRADLSATSVAAGDDLALGWPGNDTGGTWPGAGTYHLEVTGTGAIFATFVGAATSVNSYLLLAGTTRSRTASTPDETHTHVWPFPGTLSAVGQMGGDSGKSWSVYKNGAESETYSAQGSFAALSTSFLTSDYMQVRTASTQAATAHLFSFSA